MNPEIAAYYEALELRPGASEQDIKRAYFKLVRKYTPEKDPERFQKVRAAYEYLKESPAEEASENYELPDDPIACLSIEAGTEMLGQRRFGEAAKMFQAALDIVPDSPMALIGLATAYSRCGRPQKAAQAAERLTRLAPNDKHAFKLLAQSLYARGWYKKAMPAFRRAYELGNRDLQFLADYSEAARDNRLREESCRIAQEILSTGKWNKDNIMFAIDAFSTLAGQGKLKGEALKDWAEKLSDFVIRHQRIMDSGEMALFPIYTYLNQDDVSMGHSEFSTIEATLDRIESAVPSWKSEVTILKNHNVHTVLASDPRHLHEDWALLIEYSAPDDHDKFNEGMARYDKMSAQLCFLKNWASVSKEIPIIQKDYPTLYAQCRDFLEKVQAVGPDALFARLRRDFEKLCKRYEGSVYQERYPEEFEPAERVIASGDDFTPYVRTNAKIGANDPCPCGSGKKFKKCCMGTGKYD